MIKIDALWLCNQPQDMRAGADRLLTVVVTTLGEARAHHGYLFANAKDPDGNSHSITSRAFRTGKPSEV